MGESRHETHSLKASGAGGTDSPDNRNVEQVLTLIGKFDPAPIDHAATAYRDAQKAVNDAREEIKAEAHNLAKVWEGKASVEAQKALGILYATLGELAEKLGKMAHPLSEFGNVVRGHQAFLNDDWKGFLLPAWHYQGYFNAGIPFTDTGSWNDDLISDNFGVYTGYYNERGEVVNSTRAQWGTSNELAGLHLQTFGNDLKQILHKMPDNLEETLPDIHPSAGPTYQPPPVDYNFGDQRPGTGNVTPVSYGNNDLNGYRPGGRDTDGPTLGSVHSPTDTTQTDPDPREPGQQGDPSTGSTATPGGTDPRGTDPSGQNPAGATSQNPGQVPSPGTNPTTNLQDYQRPPNGYTANGGNFPTANPPGHATPNTSSFTPGTSGGPGGPGAYGGGVVPAAAPAGGVRVGGNTGMPIMPMGAMGGGAGAEQSRDRESTTWLHEDDDVWGGDTDSAVNSKIG
ncbi:WXG100 family type VII secretion target [Nonomuraea sp. SYSU D8015]|uniref:WXG100 family type VII secretion target n=1 Tax=Nonomuraea sp. SYSU D8015 TaxID=2593644 RepID=UPI0016611345|nr:WXG100 family type VII secretion target [Nonomuraea sp. SYSU D8015]